MKKTKVLFVCMGNICRSPTAEGVFRKKVAEAGLSAAVEIESSGTHAYHVGAAPDPRARTAAGERGYDLAGLVGRQVEERDFEHYDYLLAMDQDNLHHLHRRCPENYRHKLGLFMSFSKRFASQEVPDPYYGGPKGFDLVLDMVEDACHGLLNEVRLRQGLK